MQTQELTPITQEQFNKKVDTAAAYMEYMDRLKPYEARQKAFAEVSAEFTIK